MPEGRLVYSTDGGDRRKDRAPQSGAQDPPAGAGVVRVSREKGGRGGKTVTVVRGLADSDLKAVAGDLKRLCGSGGSIKGNAVEIQGDHREKVAAHLRSTGHIVRLAGG